jgi:signal peptidase II
MLKKLFITFFIFLILFFIDQNIKYIFIDGWKLKGDCISLVLAYNYGVAFSMFEFLAHYLKYIQLVLIGGGIFYLLFNKNIFKKYYLPISLIFAGGISNIYDRFIHGGVVDYIYWHCWFDFAIFNLADVLIDIAVVWILILDFKGMKNLGIKKL